MKPIWYFVGLFLFVVGVIITLTGVYYYFVPSEEHTVLENLHPSLWWGCVITVSGAVFYFANRKKVL